MGFVGSSFLEIAIILGVFLFFLFFRVKYLPAMLPKKREGLGGIFPEAEEFTSRER